ncbi:MAG: right-handed parallel beta-helix repeat-containing protein [Planctomycetales bacterium]|nr:right-handed parallel beta-helix repeat-containing protein [Planctomycetales bacterium]
MRKLHEFSLLVISLCCCMTASLHAATYYVDFGLGGVSFNGLAPIPQGQDGPFQTIEQAINAAESNSDSGDIIFVKAVASYDQPLTISEDGIQLIGYEHSVNETTVWSDLDDGRGVPPNYNEMRGLANGMPVMHKQPEINLGNRAAGKAIYVTGANVVIRNFTIHDCLEGVTGAGNFAEGTSNMTVENVVGYNFGPLIDDDEGRGITLSTMKQSWIINCRILNAGGYGVSLTDLAAGSTIVDTDVYCDEGDPGQGEGNGCDYYFVIQDTSSSTIANCYAERRDGGDGDFPGHLGHGFVLKGVASNAKSNTVQECEAFQVNEAFWFLGPKCTENTVTNCYANKTDTSENVGGSIFFSNGANKNRARQTRIKNARGGVTFDVDGGVAGQADLMSENTIENCIFERCENAINFNPHNGNPATKAKDNVFRNCTFTGRLTPTLYKEWPPGSGIYEDSRGLFYAHRDNENTTFTNCIFSDFPVRDFESPATVASGKDVYPTEDEVNFINCCFDQCGDGDPITSEGFPETQQAMDSDQAYIDCILASSSPFIGSWVWPSSVVIDEGIAVPENEDFFGTPPRQNGAAVDVGAIEGN